MNFLFSLLQPLVYGLTGFTCMLAVVVTLLVDLVLSVDIRLT